MFSHADLTIRSATAGDIPDIARLHLMAGHGLVDALYYGAVPGLTVAKIYERVLALPGRALSYPTVLVATLDGAVIAEVQAFPFDDIEKAPPDPFIPKERLGLFEPFVRLSPLGAGSYYIGILAVRPEFRGNGIGTRLAGLARERAVERGFATLSLHSFDDPRAVALYRRLGFATVGRSPLVDHPMLEFSGDLLLMTCPI